MKVSTYKDDDFHGDVGSPEGDEPKNANCYLFMAYYVPNTLHRLSCLILAIL